MPATCRNRWRPLPQSLVALPWLAAGWAMAAPSSPPPVNLLQINTGPAIVIQGKPGPWGRISYRMVFLEAPDKSLDEFPRPDARLQWHFPDRPESAVRELFERTGLPPVFRAALSTPETTLTPGGGLRFRPPADAVEALTPSQRAAIYAELAKSDLNEFQHNPVFVTIGNAAEWLKDSTLRPELKAKFGDLCYKRGGALVFSDVALLMSRASGEGDAREVMRVLTRTLAVSAQVEVAGGRELRTVAAYWSAGGRNPAAAATLATVERAVEQAPVRLNITRLLPPLPKRLLFTYPTKDLASGGRLPDCHWSSLNFFNESPDASLLDLAHAAGHLLEHYARTPGPYELGDILVFIDAQQDAGHSCVYVADDIVFTKNGSNLANPWILMPLEDLKKLYVTSEAIRIEGWRIRPPGSAGEAPAAGSRPLVVPPSFRTGP